MAEACPSLWTTCSWKGEVMLIIWANLQILKGLWIGRCNARAEKLRMYGVI